MFFQRNLKKVRGVLGITQDDMAKAVGMSRVHISRIENGTATMTRLQENAIRYVVDDLKWNLSRQDQDRIDDYLEGLPEYDVDPHYMIDDFDVQIGPGGEVYDYGDDGEED